MKIRALQRELAEARSSSDPNDKVAALESLLADANKARDRYQSDYLEAHRGRLVLQANLEHIRSGKGGEKLVVQSDHCFQNDSGLIEILFSAQTVGALRQRLNEVIGDRDQLLEEKLTLEVSTEELERELRSAKTDRK